MARAIQKRCCVGWQHNLQQLQQPKVPLPVKKQQTRPRPGSATQDVQPDAKAQRKQASDQDAEELTVPFDGAHLLECYGMTQYDTVLSLETFLQQLDWSSVAPVTRYLTATFFFCCTHHQFASLGAADKSTDACTSQTNSMQSQL